MKSPNSLSVPTPQPAFIRFERTTKATASRSRLFLVSLLALTTTSVSPAATLYWDADVTGTGNATWGVGLGGTGTWNTVLLNWWPGSGTTDQAWANANNDTAVFAGATAGTVTLGAGIATGGLVFNTNNYTLAAGANTLTFGAADNTITLNNLQSATLTGAVAGTGSNVILSGGALNGSTTAGTLTLNGTSTTGWSGTTTVGNGMTLVLAGSNQALVSTTGITLNGGGITLTNTTSGEAALNRVSDSAAITSNGGTITFNNANLASTAYAETLGPVALTSGQLNVISTNNNAAGTSQILTLGGLTQAGTSTVAFGGASLGGVSTIKNQINVTGLATTAANQIIAPWATIGTAANAQTDYAVNNINAGTGNAFGIQGAGIAGSAQTTWLNATDTYTQSTAQSLTATRTITALRNITANATTQLGANNLETFGLLNGTGTPWTIAASGAGTIRQNGTAAANLYITTGAGAISISAPITDNTGALTLVKSGTGGTLTLSGTNSYTGSTVVNAGMLQFAKEVSFYNNNTAGAGWTAANLVVNSGATAAFNVGGTGEFTSADIDTIKTLGFRSGSTLGLDTTNAGGNFTYANGIADANSGANVLGLTKLGSGNLTLSGANTYTGPTAINAGTLTLGGGNDRLATTGTVIFTGATGTLDLGSTSQTLAAIALPNFASTSTITGAGGTLTLNGALIQIGGTTGAQTTTMTGLSNFVYNNAAGSFTVGSAGTGILNLAGTNVITAGTFSVFNASSNAQTARVNLGQTNTLNANTINVGGARTIGILQFQGSLAANPTLKIRGSGGTDADRAAMVVGSNQGSSFNGTSGTVDLVTGVTGASVLDAKISTLVIGENSRATGTTTETGTFSMANGTLDATSIVLGNQTGTANALSTAIGTFNLGGGVVTVTTLTLSNRLQYGGVITGTFNLGSGTLNATTINTGTGGNSIFNWGDGTVSNNTGINQTVTALSTFNLTNTGNVSGTHTWKVDGSDTSTVAAVVSGNGSLTKTGSGSLIFNAANTYTGNTTIAAGTLKLGAAGTIATSPVVDLGTSGSQGILDVTAKASFAFSSGQTLAGYGTVNLGAGKTVTFASGSTLAPGNSAGLVNVTGDLALASGSTTNLEIISRNDGTAIAGTHFDQVAVSGDIYLGGTLNINTTGLSGLTDGDSFQLFLSSGGTLITGFTSVTMTGAYAPVLVGDIDWGTWTGTFGGQTFTFNEADGILSMAGISSIPEPSVYALFGGALALGFAVWRSRKRAC